MRQRTLDLGKRRQAHGSLSLQTIIGPSGRYRMGTYEHPLGICTVYSTARTAVITTFYNDQLLTDQRTDHPTDRQISQFCRRFLQQILASPE